MSATSKSSLGTIADLTAAFGSWDSSNIPAVTGGRGWFPSKGTYSLGLTSIQFKPDGFKSKEGAVKPTIQFMWVMLDGPDAGKEFKDERYIIDLAPLDPSAKNFEPATRERGRLRGVLEVVTGQQVAPGPAGFAYALQQAAQVIDNAGGSFGLIGYCDSYQKPGDPNAYVRNTVTAKEPLSVPEAS